MILPTYTEDEILRELIADFKIVKRIAKKKADLHQYYNKSLWEKDLLESMLYQAMGKDQKIVLSGKELFSLLTN